MARALPVQSASSPASSTMEVPVVAPVLAGLEAAFAISEVTVQDATGATETVAGKPAKKELAEVAPVQQTEEVAPKPELAPVVWSNGSGKVTTDRQARQAYELFLQNWYAEPATENIDPHPDRLMAATQISFLAIGGGGKVRVPARVARDLTLQKIRRERAIEAYKGRLAEIAEEVGEELIPEGQRRMVNALLRGDRRQGMLGAETLDEVLELINTNLNDLLAILTFRALCEQHLGELFGEIMELVNTGRLTRVQGPAIWTAVDDIHKAALRPYTEDLSPETKDTLSRLIDPQTSSLTEVERAQLAAALKAYQEMLSELRMAHQRFAVLKKYGALGFRLFSSMGRPDGEPFIGRRSPLRNSWDATIFEYPVLHTILDYVIKNRGGCKDPTTCRWASYQIIELMRQHTPHERAFMLLTYLAGNPKRVDEIYHDALLDALPDDLKSAQIGAKEVQLRPWAKTAEKVTRTILESAARSKLAQHAGGALGSLFSGDGQKEKQKHEQEVAKRAAKGRLVPIPPGFFLKLRLIQPTWLSEGGKFQDIAQATLTQIRDLTATDPANPAGPAAKEADETDSTEQQTPKQVADPDPGANEDSTAPTEENQREAKKEKKKTNKTNNPVKRQSARNGITVDDIAIAGLEEALLVLEERAQALLDEEVKLNGSLLDIYEKGVGMPEGAAREEFIRKRLVAFYDRDHKFHLDLAELLRRVNDIYHGLEGSLLQHGYTSEDAVATLAFYLMKCLTLRRYINECADNPMFPEVRNAVIYRGLKKYFLILDEPLLPGFSGVMQSASRQVREHKGKIGVAIGAAVVWAVLKWYAPGWLAPAEPSGPEEEPTLSVPEETAPASLTREEIGKLLKMNEEAKEAWLKKRLGELKEPASPGPREEKPAPKVDIKPVPKEDDESAQ
ncbi:MAG: hypothetical protein HY537_09895 [Deltaproteobacteria bacterium]|nr:hypothetical protein [Deltaproteobacteria bacterium]